MGDGNSFRLKKIKKLLILFSVLDLADGEVIAGFCVAVDSFVIWGLFWVGGCRGHDRRR
jgi:hypothetical protein